MAREFHNILVLKWGAVGDFIAGTVAITALRQRFPEARLTLLSNAAGGELCPAGGLVDAFIDRPATEGALGFFGMMKRLRAEQFDLAVNLKWTSEGAALIACLAAPATAGSGNALVRLFYQYAPPRRADDQSRHEYLKNRDIAEAVGASPGEPEAYVHIRPEEHAFAAQFFREQGLEGYPTLLISPGASTPAKAWPRERFAEIGRRFVAEQGGRVLVSWVPQDEFLARSVVETIGPGAVLCPRTSLRQIAALVARADACLCNNSGMLHIAFAVHTPAFCLNTSQPWAPYGPLAVGINSYPEKGPRNQRLLPNHDVAKLMDQITVERVWSTLVERLPGLMARCQGASRANSRSI